MGKKIKFLINIFYLCLLPYCMTYGEYIVYYLFSMPTRNYLLLLSLYFEIPKSLRYACILVLYIQ